MTRGHDHDEHTLRSLLFALPDLQPQAERGWEVNDTRSELESLQDWIDIKRDQANTNGGKYRTGAVDALNVVWREIDYRLKQLPAEGGK
jgi:hypothetical protein